MQIMLAPLVCTYMHTAQTTITNYIELELAQLQMAEKSICISTMSNNISVVTSYPSAWLYPGAIRVA